MAGEDRGRESRSAGDGKSWVGYLHSKLGRMLSPVMPIIATACSVDRYAGVDLRPGAAPTEVQRLAREAKDGDKHAQLALGERFERGDGVVRDPSRARSFYRLAATDTGGTRMIFVPQRGGAVSAVPVNTGSARSGLAEARNRLTAISDTDRLPPVRAAVKEALSHRAASGLVRLVNTGTACADKALVAQSTSYPMGTCYDRSYRMTQADGSIVDLTDLAIWTDDATAISQVPIPFGLVDAFEQSLGKVGSSGVWGRVT